MVDRDPIEPGRQIQFHLAHEVAGKPRRSAISVASSGATMKRN
jgi:hypothetical protein